MTLLAFEGFDGASAADLSAIFGYTVTGTATMSTGRFASSLNAQCVGFAGNNTDALSIPFPSAQSNFVVGVAVRWSGHSVSQRLLTFRSGASEAMNLIMDTAGKLRLRTGTATSDLVIGPTALADNQWYYVELKFAYPGSGNPTITWKVNTSLEGTYTGSANGVTAIDTMIVGFSFSTTVCPVGLKVDDFYLLDTSGSDNTDFLGDVRAELIVPDTEDANSGFTANTGTTYGAVDEALQDGDTTYVAADPVASSIDFGLTLLSTAPVAIFGVSVQAIAKRTDASVRKIATRITSSSTAATSADVTLASSYSASPQQIVERDPNGSIPWTRAAVEAASIGVVITA